MLIELESQKQSDYVFTNSLGKEYLNGHAIAFIFQATMKRADIKGFRFHDLRHTAATRMVEAEVPLFTVGQILGHTDPKTTMRYAHPDDSLKRGVETLARYNHDTNSDTKKTTSKGKPAK
jgi:integrase